MNQNLFTSSRTSIKWNKTGTDKRAGVALPLFSVYSKESIGVGEIPDLRFIINWCNMTGMSILQLLPLNEVGSDFSPYNAVSTFALEPMYLSIKRLRKADLKPFRIDIRILKKNFPKGNQKINYEIKKDKIGLLRKIFKSVDLKNIRRYNIFVERNIQWLKSYSLYKILSELNNRKDWREWDPELSFISESKAEKIIHDNPEEMKFYYWVQWQLYEQLKSVKRYAARRKILIMGDLPFLVSRNSADVWSYKNFFKLDLSSGAPPDMYFSKGQRWGMPPYNWQKIATEDYGYIKERLKYAENFFDMFRIDHFVGLFRVWTIDIKSDEEYFGLNGKFDPEVESLWEEQGRKILDTMNTSSSMLPCAEDLGTVPECSDRVLKEFGITGINVMRWEKLKTKKFNFLPAEDYRENSVSVLSTHDSSTFPAWWKYEAGTIDEMSFKMFCERNYITGEDYKNVSDKLFEINDFSHGRLKWKKEISNVYVLLDMFKFDYYQAEEITNMYLSSYSEKIRFSEYIGLKDNINKEFPDGLIKKSLLKINSTESVFSIQLIMEYLYLDKNILEKFSGCEYRINSPGTISDKNWSLVLPIALEELKVLEINKIIKGIISESGRS